MDSFESIRTSASNLHVAVSKGCTLSPLPLALAAISHLDFELYLIPPTDPTLAGALATFRGSTGTIFCTDNTDEATRATLLAHEIGHAVIHHGSVACISADIDASRSMEAAPVGLQRVEDYGGHERRELQANVFAREFLFPREVARRLYISDKMNARAIAARFGLPLNLVRQQLLDALLLPHQSIEDTSTKPISPKRDDPSQRRAATHADGPFQLQAGPGTGKTRTLVDRVTHLLLDKKVDASAILILTFSNRAAGELVERISLIAPNDAPRIWVGTFHAFGLDLVRRYHDRLGLPSDPALFDRSDAIEALEESLPILPLRHYRNIFNPASTLREIVGAISRAKDEMCSPERYLELANAMLAKSSDEESREAAEKAIEVAGVYAIYEKELKKRGCVDFGSIIMQPTLLLESDPSVRSAVQLRHRHVLVDEYQDVNHASSRFLRAIAGNGKNLWVVGDARQSIYRFRGASSENMPSFVRDYASAKADQLATNYRSSTEIVHTLVDMAPKLGASRGMLPLALQSANGASRHQPQVRSFETLEDEAAGMAASIKELEKSGVRLSDQAILCRSNSRLNEIAQALEDRDIPILHLGSFFEREEIRDLLALLSLAVEGTGAGLVRVACMSRYGIPLQDTYQAISHVRATEGHLKDQLAAFVSLGLASSGGKPGFQRIVDDLERLSSISSPWEYLCTYLLDVTDDLVTAAPPHSIRETMRRIALWQFLSFASAPAGGVAGHPIQKLLNRVRNITMLAEDRDLRQIPAAAIRLNAVRLMTVHGSKGLEFEAVHVPTMNVQSFPSAGPPPACPPPDGMVSTPDNLSSRDELKRSREEEEECLFFVASSRARTHLRYSHVRKQKGGRNRSSSKFLDWILVGGRQTIVDPPQLEGRTNGRVEGIRVIWPSKPEIFASAMLDYEKCPLRFFYTHVLKVGNARRRTAFLKTQKCIHKIVELLAKLRPEKPVDQAAALAELDRIWAEVGPADHAYAADYRRLTEGMIKFMVSAGANRKFVASTPLAVKLTSGHVLVAPDETAVTPGGKTVLRRVRTGKRRKRDDHDRLDLALYMMAARQHFGDRGQVETVMLVDELLEDVNLTDKKLDSWLTKSDGYVLGISRGTFPAEVDAHDCPRCPHFFICDAVPSGDLDLSGNKK